MTLSFKNMAFSDFFVIFGCRRVNRDEIDGDRPRLSRNCYKLSRVSWALG